MSCPATTSIRPPSESAMPRCHGTKLPVVGVLIAWTELAITFSVAEACTGGTPAAVTVTVFGYVPPLFTVVVLEMWMAMLAPGAMSPKEQASVWLGGVPLIAQVPGPVYA